jgi:hypothetical protein
MLQVFDTELVTKAGAPPQRVFTRFKEIKKASYPAIEEEEAEHSVALQTLCLAIFDAIMARCAFSDGNLHSRMPLDPTHVRLKRKMRVAIDIHLGSPLILPLPS